MQSPAPLLKYLALLALIILAYFLIRPFISAIVWAAILSFITWPAYLKLQQKHPKATVFPAASMTFLLMLACIIPSTALLLLLGQELQSLVIELNNGSTQTIEHIVEGIRKIPIVGAHLAENISQFDTFLSQGFEYSTLLLKHISQQAFTFLFTFIALFFFFRDGNKLQQHIQNISQLIFAEKSPLILYTSTHMIKAVTWGILATALAQGLSAGIAYWWFSAPSPVLLTFITILLAIIPFGAPLAWGLVVLYLASQGLYWSAAGLLLWGMLVVSTVDNIIRPIVISSAAQFPFLLVLFGVLGGFALFGVIGLFIGPVVFAVLLALWQDYRREQHA